MTERLTTVQHFLQVEADDGRWAAVKIYRSKANPEDVVLYFGGGMYEGLSGGYRYFKGRNNRMLLTDGDGYLIETKQEKKHKPSKAQNTKRKHDQRVDVIDISGTEHHSAVDACDKSSKRFSKPDASDDTGVQPAGKMQTSIPKPTTQFDNRKYRLEKAFKDNIQVDFHQSTYNKSEIFVGLRDCPPSVHHRPTLFAGERRRWSMGCHRNLPEQSEP